MTDRRRTGSCACGAVRIAAVGEPLRVGLCHCFTCRKQHAAPFGAFAIFPADRVEITGGALARFRSSDIGTRCFCPGCGAPVCHRDDGSGEVELFLGSFDEIATWQPTYEAWTPRREPWLPEVPSVRHRYPGNRPGPGPTEP